MNPSPPIIEIHGDDVTVEASYLAARLGLPVDRLRAEMRGGRSSRGGDRAGGQAPAPRVSACRWTGAGPRCGGGSSTAWSNAGRLRLTLRYRARAWTVVVQPD